MKIRVLGGGWYGCTIAFELLRDGHDVELHEIGEGLFQGASGANPARLHLGFHYPRSGATMAACLEHQAEFIDKFGHLTVPVPVNIYAVAAADSLVDYRQYIDTFRNRVQFIEIDPEEFGLRHVEGAVLTGERHIVIDTARNWFSQVLAGHVKFGKDPGVVDDPAWSMTIDCTFCANDEQNIDRFEPCVTGLLLGPVNRAVTIMDGQFGSIYPWNEGMGLSSLTSAKFTPLSRTCRTKAEADAVLAATSPDELLNQCAKMLLQMSHYWPAAMDVYRIAGYRTGVRAMPKSAADSRLVDVVRVGERALRVRAGKIDAVFHAARTIRNQIRESRSIIRQAVVH